MDIALFHIISMDKNTIREYQKHFNEHCCEVLSVYNQKTNQEDYTDTKRWKVDWGGKKFNQYQKDNYQILEAIEKLKRLYRHALSRW